MLLHCRRYPFNKITARWMLSTDLPREYFKSILSSVGLSEGVVSQLFSKICEANLKAREDLVASLDKSTHGANVQLIKALMYEIILIRNSSLC